MTLRGQSKKKDEGEAYSEERAKFLRGQVNLSACIHIMFTALLQLDFKLS